MLREIWKPVVEDGIRYPYDVSNYFRVRRAEPPWKGGGYTYAGRILKAEGWEAGVNLSFRGQVKKFRVRRLVMRAFNLLPEEVGPVLYPSKVVLSKGGSESDDVGYIEQAETTTVLEKLMRAEAIFSLGVEHPLSKLDEFKVKVILCLLDMGFEQRDIASVFGVVHSTVGCINRRSTWKGVDYEGDEKALNEALRIADSLMTPING